MLTSLMSKWSKLDPRANWPGLALIVLGSILGALVGMIGGFILSNLLRFFAMIFNRPLGGYSWVIVGTFVGALVFAIMALNGDKN